MSLPIKLSQWFKTKPLILLKLQGDYEQALLSSKHGLERFTFAKPHALFRELKVPALCLVEMLEEANGCCVGIVKSKTPVTTVDSRLTLIKLRVLNLASFDELVPKLAKKSFQTALKQKLASDCMALRLTPKLSVAIIEALSSDSANRKAIEAATFNIPQLRKISALKWEQLDAIKTALAAFGLSLADSPNMIEVPEDSDSALDYLGSNMIEGSERADSDVNYLGFQPAHALEDNVIARDASILPGFELIEKHVTGRAVFQKKDEQLVVYTANKGPLEAMLGVDLIYVNETLGNTVMVQYKMLKENYNPTTYETDWIFRPDGQLEDEIARMKLPTISGTINDYRLHRNPFFFKFVRRKGDGESHKAFVISLDHLNHLLVSPKSKGPRDGVRVSYEALGGAYLRESDLIGLIRSGYIGTHRVESDALNPIISEVAKGNRSLVLAWQRKVLKEVSPEDTRA